MRHGVCAQLLIALVSGMRHTEMSRFWIYLGITNLVLDNEFRGTGARCVGMRYCVRFISDSQIVKDCLSLHSLDRYVGSGPPYKEGV